MPPPPCMHSIGDCMQVRKNKLLRFERRKSALRSRHGHSQHKNSIAAGAAHVHLVHLVIHKNEVQLGFPLQKQRLKTRQAKISERKIYKSILQRDLHFKNTKSRNPSLYFIIYTSLNLEVQNNMRAFLLENHVNTWVSANTH